MTARCLWCKAQLSPPRRKFCSTACLRAHTAWRTRRYRTDWQRRARLDPAYRARELDIERKRLARLKRRREQQRRLRRQRYLRERER